MRVHEKVAPTLRANAKSHEPIVFPQRAYGEYEDSEVGSTLKAYGGNVGGGSENIACVYESHNMDARYDEKAVCPALSARMGTGGLNVPLKIDKAYALKVSQTGANGRPYKEGASFSLTGQDYHVVQRIARKLTPKECERLQGLPDGYTDYGSDSKRYKALGNGMAQPCADYVMMQVVKAIKRGESNERENGTIGDSKESS